MNKHSDNNDFSTRRTRVNNHERNEAICLCPLEGVIDIISKKWALLIINEIGNHTQIRYNDLMKELGNISPKTLADTLKALNKYDLVRRESFNEIPPRVDYSLTNNGQELRRAIIPILQWAIKERNRCSTLFVFYDSKR